MLTRRSLLPFACLAIVLGVLLSGSAPRAHAGAEKCNGIDDDGNGLTDEGLDCRQHYLAYRIRPTKFTPRTVFLTDQFSLDAAGNFVAAPFKVIKPVSLLNPVKKRVDAQGLVQIFPITRPELHYIGYLVDGPFSPRAVNIDNQFERAKIEVRRADRLLVPAAKRKRDPASGQLPVKLPIPKAEHYLCYEVEPARFAIPVGLSDQFQARPFQVVERTRICNPVTKEHAGGFFPADIRNPRNHLTCYRVVDPFPAVRPVIVRDQFLGARNLSVAEEEELCVPTVKTELHACALPDNGQGTATLLDPTVGFQGRLNGLPPGIPVTGARALLAGFSKVAVTPLPLGGEVDSFFDVFADLTLEGDAGLDRTIRLSGSGALAAGPRTPGDPVQSFDTEMLQLQLQVTGDPDFDLLRITAGSSFGLPSPGHTTLTRQQPGGGGWAVDSFFDITYRIDFKGAGPLSGHSGSTTGTIRLSATCPLP